MIGELLADGSHTTVAQVVDVIDVRLGVDELNQIFDNLDDVLLGQDTHIHAGVEIQFFIYPITTDITKVIPLL